MSDDPPAATSPISVVIPECGTPDILAGTLEALAHARADLPVASTACVLVNGAPAAAYRTLQALHPSVGWHFERKALGFHGAMARLLATELHPWVYLLNSDMRLHADGLRALLPWRAVDVFAVASQIEWPHHDRRREETGYTVPVIAADGQLELHDLIAPDSSVRGNLYASGGAALFQTAALRRCFRLSHAYAPFYFEDADWSLQAWASGLRVLYCPASRASHLHRATIGRVVTPARLQRIVRRNLGHLRWRYADAFAAPRWSGHWSEQLGALLRSWSGRHREARAAVQDSAVAAVLPWLHMQRYPHSRLWRSTRLRVLLVCSFSVLPPAASDARRVIDQVRASAGQIDWVLLQGEAGSPAGGAPAGADDAVFRAIHPVGAGSAHGVDSQPHGGRPAHAVLRLELARLVALYRVDAICAASLACLELLESWQGSTLIRSLADVLAIAARQPPNVPRVDHVLPGSAISALT